VSSARKKDRQRVEFTRRRTASAIGPGVRDPHGEEERASGKGKVVTQEGREISSPARTRGTRRRDLWIRMTSAMGEKEEGGRKKKEGRDRERVRREGRILKSFGNWGRE